MFTRTPLQLRTKPSVFQHAIFKTNETNQCKKQQRLHNIFQLKSVMKQSAVQAKATCKSQIQLLSIPLVSNGSFQY